MKIGIYRKGAAQFESSFCFVNTESFHELEAGRNFQVAQHAFIGVKDFAEQIELPRRDVVLEAFLGKNGAVSFLFVNGVNGLPLQGVKNGRGVNGVGTGFLEIGFTDAGNELGNGRLVDVAVERISDGTKRRQKHTALRIRAGTQTISDTNPLPVGTDEFGSRHFLTS